MQSMDLFDYDRRNPCERAPSLEYLCRFADHDFICCAFVTMLGRQPDPVGEAYYLHRLRQGVSKLSILLDMRRSREGRAHDPGIAGLDRILKRHRNANLPLIGWAVRFMTRREGNSELERSLRVMSNMLVLESNKAAARAAHANHMHFMLVQKAEGIERQLKITLAGQATSPRQIAQAEAAGAIEWESTLTSALSGH